MVESTDRPHRSELFICGSIKGPSSKKRNGFENNPEPSSPKVTCIGQVRVKTKKQGKKMRMISSRSKGSRWRFWEMPAAPDEEEEEESEGVYEDACLFLERMKKPLEEMEKPAEVMKLMEEDQDLLDKMEDNLVEYSKKWLHYLSTGGKGTVDLEVLTLNGLRIVDAHKGFFHCAFIVPHHLSDPDGFWSVGAMATMIDAVGASAVCSSVGLTTSVDFTVSYYSRVNAREEVEIVAEIVGEMGKLVCVVVKVTKKGSGEMVALGKQWMALFTPKTKLSQVSEVTSRL